MKRNSLRIDTGKYVLCSAESFILAHIVKYFPLYVMIFVNIFLLHMLVQLAQRVFWLLISTTHIIKCPQTLRFYLDLRNVISLCLLYSLWCVSNCFPVTRDKWYTNCCHIILVTLYRKTIYLLIIMK